MRSAVSSALGYVAEAKEPPLVKHGKGFRTHDGRFEIMPTLNSKRADPNEKPTYMAGRVISRPSKPAKYDGWMLRDTKTGKLYFTFHTLVDAKDKIAEIRAGEG